MEFDPAYAVRVISDLVPNPFVGRESVGKLLDELYKRGFSDAKLGRHGSLIIDELRKGLDEERTKRAEGMFKSAAEAGSIQFRLRLDGKNWQIPRHTSTTQPEGAPQLTGSQGGALERNLFAQFIKRI